jgi:hypothetical protein
MLGIVASLWRERTLSLSDQRFAGNGGSLGTCRPHRKREYGRCPHSAFDAQIRLAGVSKHCRANAVSKPYDGGEVVAIRPDQAADVD